jgi:hypothetical protein
MLVPVTNWWLIFQSSFVRFLAASRKFVILKYSSTVQIILQVNCLISFMLGHCYVKHCFVQQSEL